jgi:hypothetical protein
MASIQKRRSRRGPRYRVQVRVRGAYQSATFPSRAQARRWATRIEHALWLPDRNGENIAHVPYLRLSHIQDYVTQHVIGAHATGLRSPNHMP